MAKRYDCRSIIAVYFVCALELPNEDQDHALPERRAGGEADALLLPTPISSTAYMEQAALSMCCCSTGGLQQLSAEL